MAIEPDPTEPSPPTEPVLRRPLPARNWRDWLEALADTTGVSPRRIAVAGVCLVGAVLVVAWSTRPARTPPEVSLPFAPTTAAIAGPAVEPGPRTLVVHVAGAVQRPGVHELPQGARVVDAIDAAGGLTSDADGARVNLAALVSDGERVYIPSVGEEAPPALAVGGTGGPHGTAQGPLNLNQADEAALDALPGVGPATASAIVEHRRRIGRFTSVDQLLDVRGIGEAKLEQLRPLVTV